MYVYCDLVSNLKRRFDGELVKRFLMSLRLTGGVMENFLEPATCCRLKQQKDINENGSKCKRKQERVPKHFFLL